MDTVRFPLSGTSSGEPPYSWTHFSVPFSGVFSDELSCSWTWRSSSLRSSAVSCPARRHFHLPSKAPPARAALLVGTVQFPFPSISSGELPYSWTQFSPRSPVSPAASCPARGHASSLFFGHLQQLAAGSRTQFGLRSLASPKVSCLLPDLVVLIFQVFSGELCSPETQHTPHSRASSAASCAARGHSSVLVFGRLQRRAAPFLDTVRFSLSGVSSGELLRSRS